MDEKIIELLQRILTEVLQLRKENDRVSADLAELAERFDIAVTQLENDRRLDFFNN